MSIENGKDYFGTLRLNIQRNRAVGSVPNQTVAKACKWLFQQAKVVQTLLRKIRCEDRVLTVGTRIFAKWLHDAPSFAGLESWSRATKGGYWLS